MPHEKDFAGWFAHQVELEQESPPHWGFEEGQVWRCAIGHNIGHELDGRSQRYWRPVLVLRKLSADHLLGVPLTSSANQQPFRIPVVLRDKKSYAVIDQVRSLDARRLRQLLGELSADELQLIREELVSLLAAPPPSGRVPPKSSDASNPAGTRRIRRFKTEAALTVTGNRLSLTFSDEMDLNHLFPEGPYRLTIFKGAITRAELKQRMQSTATSALPLQPALSLALSPALSEAEGEAEGLANGDEAPRSEE